MKNDTFPLRLDKEACISCGACVESCAYQAIRMDDYPEIQPDACRLCGSCVEACPAGALTLTKAERVVSPWHANAEGVYVLAETEGGVLTSVTFELLGKATELARKRHSVVSALLVGADVQLLAHELIRRGADRVHVAESPLLASYIDEHYAAVTARLVQELQPEILLVGATPKGRGLSARLASLLQTGLTADCTSLDIDPASGLLHQVRPAFGGNLMATIVTPVHRPQMASVRPGIMQALPAEERKGEIICHDLTGFQVDPRIHLVCETKEKQTAEAWDNSRIIVGIGRGVKKLETVRKIQAWAQRIGAEVAGSRAAVEAGLVDAHRQVGQTGHTIAPDLYIAIGISGQIQHTAAIQGCKHILAVNPDANAPIFSLADQGWVATAEDFLRAIEQEG